MAVDDEDPPPRPSAPPKPPGLSNLALAGCLLAYVLVFIAGFGLPVALLYGLVSGDWRLVILWAIVTLIVLVLGRRNLIPIIY